MRQTGSGLLCQRTRGARCELREGLVKNLFVVACPFFVPLTISFFLSHRNPELPFTTLDWAAHLSSPSSLSVRDTAAGYNFLEVVRWFAKRLEPCGMHFASVYKSSCGRS